MIFRHVDIDQSLSWDENHHINELIIENQPFMRKMIAGLVDADNQDLSISEKSKHYVMGKEIDVIFNPLDLNFNNRRAMATLLKMLVKTSLSEDFYMSTNNLKTKIVKYLDKVVDADNFIFDVETDDFTLDSIAKAINIHIVSDDDDFIELLTDYMSMMVELAGVKLFVFVNLRMYITDGELARLTHNIDNHQLDVLLIEGKDFGKISCADRIIIDTDSSEI